MKVVIADTMDFGAKEVLENAGLTVDMRPALGEVTLDEVIHDADGLLIRSATRATSELISNAPKLKAIGRAGIGIDNIDINAATKAKIVVMNTPLANATSTAEHAIALLFSIARSIPQANTSTHDGKWEKTKFIGRELSNKTLGIIGCGNIGKIVADRALGLRMHVAVFDPFLNQDTAKEMGVTQTDLQILLKQSHFISLHAPLTPSTREILSSAEFELMRDGVYIVNTARSGLIEEKSLHKALNSKKVAGIAMDVYEEEPLKTHTLYNHPQVIMTPHIAASTTEAQANVALQIAEQMANYLLYGTETHVLNQVS